MLASSHFLSSVDEDDGDEEEAVEVRETTAEGQAEQDASQQPTPPAGFPLLTPPPQRPTEAPPTPAAQTISPTPPSTSQTRPPLPLPAASAAPQV